ncbi:MAG: TonB family protein [Symploca sp. SIO2E9]|nr:TonB family protein [Symploca sp. SIO2E9]
MSYTSFIQSIPGKLNQPLSIAVMASVGIHALLGVTLPPMWSSEKPQKQRNVELLELTPSQQSRLPELSTLPLIPNQNNSLSPFPSIKPSPIPYSIYQNSQLDKYPIPSLANPYRLSVIPQLPKERIRIGGNLSRYRRPIQPNRRNNTRGSFPVKTDRLPPPPSTPSLLGNGVEPSNPKDFQLESSNQRDYAIFPGYDLRQYDFKGSNQPESNSSDTKEPNFPPNTENNSIEEPRELGSIALHRKEKVVALREEIRQRQQSLRKDESNTSLEDANTNLLTWMNTDAVKKVLPEEEEKIIPQRQNFNGTYPQDACSRQVEGTAVYGVLVGTDGAPTESSLIRSSGYPILNNQALQDITSRSFSNQTGKPKPYQVHVTFKPENCKPLKVFQDSPSPNSASPDSGKPAPVIQEPAVEEPTDKKPTVEIPAVEEPTDKKPTVEIPAVEEPTDKKPTVEIPAVEEPTDKKPTVEIPAVEEPTDTKPTVEIPAVEEPTDTKPTVEIPAVEEPADNQPTVEIPAVEEPTDKKPTVEIPAVEEPADNQPTVEIPTVEEPTDKKPTVEIPTVEEPTDKKPTVEIPTVEEPTHKKPTVEIPVFEEPAENKLTKNIGFKPRPSLDGFLWEQY